MTEIAEEIANNENELNVVHDVNKSLRTALDKAQKERDRLRDELETVKQQRDEAKNLAEHHRVVGGLLPWDSWEEDEE